MNKTELTQKCIDIFGHEAQCLKMVEEGAELTAALLQKERDQKSLDHVCEEIADVYAVLDSMDIIFEVKIKYPPRFFENKMFEIIHTIGVIQTEILLYLGEYTISLKPKAKFLRELFSTFRHNLDVLSQDYDKDKIKHFQKEKAARMIKFFKKWDKRQDKK